MSDIVKRLKLNKLSLFITLFIACAAAFSTLFFAMFEGVQNMATIIFRVFISFAVFAVIGYFIAEIFENEYLSTTAKNSNKKDTAENELKETSEQQEENDIQTNDDAVNEQNEDQTQQDEHPQEENNMDMLNDDSFDKIVVVDKDTDE